MSRNALALLGAALAITGWFAAGMPILIQTAVRQRAAALKLTLRASVNSTAQLFFDVGRGTRAEDSALSAVLGGVDALDSRFELPAQRVLGLRLDPLTGPGELIVEAASIVDGRGNALYALSLDEFVPLGQIKAVEKRPDGLHILTDAGAADPALAIRLPYPLDFRGRDGLSKARLAAIFWWHALHGLFLATALAACWRLGGRRWARALDLWPASQTPAAGGVRLKTGAYLLGALLTLAAGCFYFEETLFRWLTS